MSDKSFVPLIDYAEINCCSATTSRWWVLRSPCWSISAVVTVLKGLLLMVFVPLYWPLIGLDWIK